MIEAHIAITDTEHGIDVLYAGRSAESAKGALAGFCRNWWLDEEVDFSSGVYDPSTLSDDDVISYYFQNENVLLKGERGVIEVVQFQD